MNKFKTLNRFIFKIKNTTFRKYAVNEYNKALLFESISTDKKQEIIFSRQKELLNHAYYNTKFYRSFYENHGFHPNMFLTEDDWGKVPVLEKDMIRKFTDDFFSENANMSHMKEATTGGSTGKPLKVYKNKKVPTEILAWRSLKWWSVHPSDNKGVINRSVPKSLLQKTKSYIIWWPTKKSFLDATSVTNEKIACFVKQISKKKIKYLVGYCGTLEKIADFIIKNNIKIEYLNLVWSTTSPLTKSIRIKMEKAFKCKIMDQYGSVEVFHIAVQKPNEDCLTVNADYVHLDIIDSNNNIINNTGEMGDIIVTDLRSKSFPIIKYRLGDRSRMIKTFDTSYDGFPKIDFVKGRISDCISFQDGSYLDGAFLTTFCDGYEDVIDSYQVYQDNQYRVFFRIVLADGVSSSNKRLNLVINKFRDLVKVKADFEVEFVDVIPDDRGKMRFIISDVKNQ